MSSCAATTVLATIHTTGAFSTDDLNMFWSGTNSSSQPAIMMCTPTLGNCANPIQFTLATTTNIVSYGPLYWTDTSAGAVMKCTTTSGNTSGCTATSAIASFLVSPSVLAVDGTNVYWSDSLGVHQCPVGGCGATSPVTLGAGQQNANSIVADGNYVYWANGSSVIRAHVGVADSAAAIAQNQAGAATVGTGTKGIYWSVQNGAVMMLAK
jgi:hypothetical protein